MSCLAAAAEYAKRGFRVFPLHSVRHGVCTCQEWREQNNKGPCPTPGKHPRFRNWQERASCDPTAVEEMWWNHNGSNIGIATGATSGVFVLDVDPKNGGEESIDTLVAKYGRISESCGLERALPAVEPLADRQKEARRALPTGYECSQPERYELTGPCRRGGGVSRRWCPTGHYQPCSLICSQPSSMAFSIAFASSGERLPAVWVRIA